MNDIEAQIRKLQGDLKAESLKAPTTKSENRMNQLVRSITRLISKLEDQLCAEPHDAAAE